MEKQRALKNTVIGVLLVCVLCLSVAFAGFSQALSITGTAKVTSATTNWNVKFTSVDALGTDGYATGSADTITGSAETITFTCNVKAPGDACTLNGEIKNLGSIKAKYTSVSFNVTGGTGSVNGTEYTDDDVTITLTPPALWTANTTVLNTNDTGDFSLALTVEDDAALATAKTYTITATFNFAQA